MARLIRPAITWLLLLALPFQVLTAVYLDMRGPLHFHVESDDDYHHHDHAHSHDRDHLERHHHHHGDPSVVTVHHDGVLEPLALEVENPSGWSSTMLVALLGGGSSLELPEMSGSLTPRTEPPLKTRFPGRLERPPRTPPI